jgi:hypothetical protein
MSTGRLKTGFDKKCLRCGKEFYVRKSLGRVMYCSRRCAKLGKSPVNKGVSPSEKTRKLWSEQRKGKTPWNKGRRDLPKQSEETIKKRMDKIGKGEQHHSWKGGISRNLYPSEFNPELKLRIRTRDNFICVLCGRTEREELEELNRVLCVNHIDFDKNNCKEDNLNTLCVRCNTKINREREYWTDYFNQKYGK